MCSGSEAGSYSRLIDFVYPSTLGMRVIKKKKKFAGMSFRVSGLGYGFSGMGFRVWGFVYGVSGMGLGLMEGSMNNY